ncbi:hypothetical protein [Diaphorobacter aerolatus]|uniref:Uncharacterized protein n=1 Tax=Diaphorobacter aerolatus TaxID=1288495 RepID=A0A7H0GLR2_9BURK|nr:hypothetical protein [Diaphorobacter aerolatus]QNP49228.1 hypothetical protein H9K75_03760 [Diaphorobacter aerolatus]
MALAALVMRLTAHAHVLASSARTHSLDEFFLEIDHAAPVQAMMKDWYSKKPERFKEQV